MGTLYYCLSLPKLKKCGFSAPNFPSRLEILSLKTSIPTPKIPISCSKITTILIGVTALISITGPSSAIEFPILKEPSNALSLPTWAVHVSSVLECLLFIKGLLLGLVWQYGDKSGYQSWKGLSWGMVPLLGGALCACTWHFFYNSESLEVLVALQAALTVIGNMTMCIAAYRIYISSQESSKKS